MLGIRIPTRSHRGTRRCGLVGTFLGILLAYGVVSPLAQAVGQRAEEGGQALECIKACILAQQQGYNPQIAVEFGRKIMASELRPSFRT